MSQEPPDERAIGEDLPEDPVDDSFEESPDTLEWHVGDTLDLHTFLPKETADLVRDYLDLSIERGFAQVRLIHGKGIGVQRRIVHSILDKDPRVLSYRPADEGGGGWGATVVDLAPRSTEG